MKVTIEFILNDLWVGAYWRRDKVYGLFHLYICLVPCIPIHITFDRVYHEAKKLSPLVSKVLKEDNHEVTSR